MMDYILDNKEWLFSGVGLTLITLLVWLFKRNRQTSKVKHKSSRVIHMTGKNPKYIENIKGKVNIN